MGIEFTKSRGDLQQSTTHKWCNFHVTVEIDRGMLCAKVSFRSFQRMFPCKAVHQNFYIMLSAFLSFWNWNVISNRIRSMDRIKSNHHYRKKIAETILTKDNNQFSCHCIYQGRRCLKAICFPKLLEALLPYSSTVLAHQTVGTLTHLNLNWQGNKKKEWHN